MPAKPNAEAPVAAASLDALLALRGADFVRCAYLTLLGRDADVEGLRYYGDRLNQGYSRMSVVAQLCKSGEAGLGVVALPGLAAAVRRYRRSHWPVIGALFRRRPGEEGDTRAERERRELRNQLYLLGEVVRQQADLIETRCKLIDESVQRLRSESEPQGADLRAAIANLARLVEDAARQHGALRRESKLRSDQASEALAELGQRVEAGQRRLDEIEQALGDLQDALRRGAPLPAPLGPLALKSQRQLSAGARAVYGRLRKAFTQVAR